MAVTITETPNPITKKGQKLIVMATSTNVSQQNFRYIVEVLEDSTSIAKFYVEPNPADSLVFDLQNIVLDRLKAPTTTPDGDIIHEMPHTADQAFCKIGTDAMKKYIVQVGEVYGDPLTEYTNLDEEAFILFDGYFQLKNGYQPALTEFEPGDATRLGWLTERQPSSQNEINKDAVEIRADESDYGTLAFLNDRNNFDSDAERVLFEIFSSDSTLGNSFIEISSANGAPATISNATDEKIVYFAGLPGNLNKSDHPLLTALKPANNSSWRYYTLQLADSSNVPCSQKIYVVRDTAPCKHDPAMLAWVNAHGGWEYYRFDARVIGNYNRQAKTYMKQVGSYGSSSFGFDSFDPEEVPFQVSGERVLQLKHRGVRVPEDGWLLVSALKSKQVMVHFQGEWIPVVLDTNNIRYENNPISKALEVTINVKIAQREIC